MSKEKIKGDVTPSKATEMVRREVRNCARHQGGAHSSDGNEYVRPQTSAKDIAGGDRANSDPMARHSRDEWQMRNDQEYDDMDYYRD
jgi:hypothetical protein